MAQSPPRLPTCLPAWLFAGPALSLTALRAALAPVSPMSDPAAPSCRFPWSRLLPPRRAPSVRWGPAQTPLPEPPAHISARVHRGACDMPAGSGNRCDSGLGLQEGNRRPPLPQSSRLSGLQPGRRWGASGGGHVPRTRARTGDPCHVEHSEVPQQMGKWGSQGPQGSRVPITAGTRHSSQPPRGWKGGPAAGALKKWGGWGPFKEETQDSWVGGCWVWERYLLAFPQLRASPG